MKRKIDSHGDDNLILVYDKEYKIGHSVIEPYRLTYCFSDSVKIIRKSVKKIVVLLTNEKLLVNIGTRQNIEKLLPVKIDFELVLN